MSRNNYFVKVEQNQCCCGNEFFFSYYGRWWCCTVCGVKKKFILPPHENMFEFNVFFRRNVPWGQLKKTRFYVDEVLNFSNSRWDFYLYYRSWQCQRQSDWCKKSFRLNQTATS